MAEESPPVLPPAEEPTEAGTPTALKPEPESGEPTPESTSNFDFVCDCDWRDRLACLGEPFYREFEGNRYCVLHYPGWEKRAAFNEALQKKLDNRSFDFRGVWFPDLVHFKNCEFSSHARFSYATFRSIANFSNATFSANADFRSAKFNGNADFSGATFKADADFSVATFDAKASFVRASFNAKVDFTEATFGEHTEFFHATFAATTHFSYAKFRAEAQFLSNDFREYANFGKADFSANADFSYSRFDAGVGFGYSNFRAKANFSYTIFNHPTYFHHALFQDSLSFLADAEARVLDDGSPLQERVLGKNPSLDFQDARMEKPTRISFRTVALRPSWFVNVDPRHFVFTDVNWKWEIITIRAEIESLTKKQVPSPHRLLAIACRQLAENAEANNRYEEASRFRYWAMDLARRTKWKGRSFWKTDWLHMLYWAVSGYGERIRRALGVLAAVWLVFALLYTRVGFAQQPPKVSNAGASSATAASMTTEDRIGQPLEFSRALIYSLGVMSLQKPDPKPLTGTAQTLVLLETILGPVQAALLALAIRRKFMR